MGNFIFGGGSKSLNKGGLLTCRGRKALPLSFTLQPQAKTVDEYALATFSCEVTGGVAPYAYQWKKNGTNVGTNIANLSFTAAAADKNASITVVVTDSVGTVITSSAAVLGVTSYAFNFDGVSQKVTLSSPLNIPVSTDFSLEFYLKGQNSATLRPFGRSDNFTSRLFIGTPGDIGFFDANNAQYTSAIGAYAPYFGVRTKLIISRVGTTLRVTANSSVILELLSAASVSFSINQLMSHSSNLFGSGNITEIKLTVSGALTNSLPLNNKSQGANQLATVGSVNATITNYNAANWVAI